MGFLSGLFSKSGRRREQLVIVYLDSEGLPPEVYAQNELSTLDEQLSEAMETSGAGVVEGNEFNPGETLIYLYGESAEEMFAAAEPVLRSNPLCRNARVELRDDRSVLRELRLGDK